MTVQHNADAICGGCFLYERRGVCPAARDAYGLQNSVEAEHRAERFHRAVIEDAQSTVGLRELVCLDVERQGASAELAASRRLVLLSPAASPVSYDSRKEQVHVATTRIA